MLSISKYVCLLCQLEYIALAESTVDGCRGGSCCSYDDERLRADVGVSWHCYYCDVL
jgi:hypothetical protein